MGKAKERVGSSSATGKRKQEEISGGAGGGGAGGGSDAANPIDVDGAAQASSNVAAAGRDPSAAGSNASAAAPQVAGAGSAKRQKVPDEALKNSRAYFARKRQEGTLGKTPSGGGAPVTLPKGKPMCLSGKSFVVTGVLPSLDRDAAKDFIKEWGGSVKTAVSGKTNFLVAGDVLEDGRPVTASSKYRKAVDKKVKIIGQAELLEMVASTYDPATEAAAAAAAAAAQTSSSSASSSSSSSSSSSAGVVRPRSHDSRPNANDAAAAISRDASRRKQMKDRANGAQQHAWADKHKPSDVKDLLGNGGHVRNIQNWSANGMPGTCTKRKNLPGTSKTQAQRLFSSLVPWYRQVFCSCLGAHAWVTVMELNAAYAEQASRETSQMSRKPPCLAGKKGPPPLQRTSQTIDCRTKSMECHQGSRWSCGSHQAIKSPRHRLLHLQ